MKSRRYNRQICLLMVIMMMLFGVQVGNNDMYSFFACQGSSPFSANIQRVGSERLISVYLERRHTERAEELVKTRQFVRPGAGIRVGQWLLLLPLVANAFSLSELTDISFIQSGACINQNRLRILQYIHRKDGKKA